MRLLFLASFMLVSIACFSQSDLANENSNDSSCFNAHFAQMYESSWHLLEDIFITQPRSRIDNRSAKSPYGNVCCSDRRRCLLYKQKGLRYS